MNTDQTMQLSDAARRAVRLGFNPSANPRVDQVKALFAQIIGVIQDAQTEVDNAIIGDFDPRDDDTQFDQDYFVRLSEHHNNCVAAIELITQASMRTVHALTADVSRNTGNVQAPLPPDTEIKVVALDGQEISLVDPQGGAS